MPAEFHPIRTLLIVDDDPEVRLYLEAQVKALGYQTRVADDGVSALELTGQMTFHAVICDFAMPKMNGIDFLTQLRARGHDMPFIFLTGSSVPQVVVNALRLGATDFLSKPFDEAEFRSVIERALEMGIKKKTIDDAVARLKNSSVPSVEDAETIERGRKQIARLQAASGKNRRPA